LSGRGLCDELITRPEESYRLCCVVVCYLETSRMGAPYIYDISHLRVKYVQRRVRSVTLALYRSKRFVLDYARLLCSDIRPQLVSYKKHRLPPLLRSVT